MPRPPRCRRICDAPQVDTFCPQGHEEAAPILLTLDEYEVIRLVDLEQRTHQQCAAQMDISRSTVQEIYESARRKIAACLVYGRKLVITGGSYRICGGQEQARCTQCCRTKSEETHSNMQQHKGEANMKIAVTYANGQIFQHFGHTEQFKIYEIDGDRIVASEVVDTNGSGHGALAGFLMQHGVRTARNELDAHNVDIRGGDNTGLQTPARTRGETRSEPRANGNRSHNNVAVGRLRATDGQKGVSGGIPAFAGLFHIHFDNELERTAPRNRHNRRRNHLHGRRTSPRRVFSDNPYRRRNGG